MQAVLKEKCETLFDFRAFGKQVYETVLKSRFMDEKMSILVKQNKGGTFHMNGLGHELVGAVCAHLLTSGSDWAFPYYRDKALAIGLGASLEELFGTFLGRYTKQHSSGRMMPEHFCSKSLNIPPQSSVVGTQFLQACGLAKGLSLLKKKQAVYVSAGDGATSQGDFHEALNIACLHRLGVIFVIQDNGYAISVPILEQTAGGSIAKMAKAYSGLDVFEVSGTKIHDLFFAFKKALAKAREGEGPSLIVAKVPRLGPHSSSDDPKKYKSHELIEAELSLDPLIDLESSLVEEGLLTLSEINALREKIKETIDLAAKAAEQIPFPDPLQAKEHVFKETSLEEVCADTKGEEIVMVDALNHALKEAMQEDPDVLVFGQDVARGKGGVFGVTRELTALFGEERCFNTPLAESTIIGLAIGLCFDGVHKPVVEIQFADYLWTGINQLFNELASMHYRSNGQWNCPLVIRMPIGGYIQGGPYHSQSIEAFIAHCPGLKIAFPSDAHEAKVLLKAAIKDPNPVIFFEHKALYRQRVYSAREEPLREEIKPLGLAKVIKEGSDATLITYGMTTLMSYEIAQKLESEIGCKIEVIDLCSLCPLDLETITQSVKKTGKVVIAHEAPKRCGFGAEIAAWIAEELFTYLDAPVIRLGSFESAVPYSKPLEEAILLQKHQIEKALRDLIAY